jgi:hypothetical protein
MSDLQVSIEALRNFAKAIRNNVLGGSDSAGVGLAADERITDPMQRLGSLDFGQDVSGFGTAATLYHHYRTAYLGYRDNYQELRDALATLAAAADKIAQRYEDAASLDAVSAKMVDDVIAESQPVPSTTPPGSTS